MIEIKHRTTREILLRLEDESLQGKNLAGAALADADLSGCTLSYCCMRGADLSRALLDRAVMNNVVLDAANLERASLREADLTTLSLLGGRAPRVNLQGAVLRYAHLAGADLQSANLQGVDASMADLRANFRDAVLIGANLRGSNLAGANLQFADLTNADLTSANLAGANLRGAQLRGVKLDRALDKTTEHVLAAGPVVGWKPLTPERRKGNTALIEAIRVTCPHCDLDSRVPKDRMQHKFQCRGCKQIFFVTQYGRAVVDQPSTTATPATAQKKREVRADQVGSPALKWRGSLQVRYLGGGERSEPRLRPGDEGLVVEFFGPAGNDWWQVEFPSIGIVNVPRNELGVLNAEFVRESADQDTAEAGALLKTATEAVLYANSKGQFKSLVVWHRDGRHDSIVDWLNADRLIRLCKERRIPVSKDRWFD